MNNDASIEIPTTEDTHVERRSTVVASTSSRRSRATKHLSQLEAFLRSLDLAVFVQLSVIYYLDCRLLLLFLRAFTQILTFARVPSAFQAPATIDPTTQPVIGLLFSSNFICLFVHLFGHVGHAGEVTQFYQHGGILVDFIGERTPISRTRLVVLDALVCTMQLVMLSASIEKSRLSKIQSSISATSTNTETINPTGTQTIEAEEQGENADAQDPLLSDILSSQGAGVAESPDAHPLDSFATGRHMIVDINLGETVRRQWRLWKHGTPLSTGLNRPDPTPGSTGGTEQQNGIANLISPFGFRVRVGGRTLGTGS